MILGSTYFVLCAIACLAGALVTVLAHNPIRGALGLLVTIMGIAGLYLKLHAQFLAAIQLIVYAGAVVVLFVFVLMLLGTDAIDKATTRRSVFARGAGGIGLIAIVLLAMFRALHVYTPRVIGKFGRLPEDFGSVSSVGKQLFADALVPFELATALLIVAIIGAIAVARTSQKKPPQTGQPDQSAHRFFGGPIHPRDTSQPIIKEPIR